MTRNYLGFDFGLRRIGVAVGSDATRDARPLDTVANRDSGPDWHLVDRMVADWSPGGLVVGVPYNADGSAYGLTESAGEFADRLAERYRLPVHRVDERYTSRAANEELVARRKRGDHRRLRHEDVDAAAAAVILSDWLNGTGGT